MTKVQKVFCVFLCLCFFAVLVMLPEPFSLWETLQNVYRQFPFYYFIEEKAQETWLELDGETLAEIGKRNGEYLGELAEAERNLEGKDTKKSDAANLEKNSGASEAGKKENSTDKLETNSEDKSNGDGTADRAEKNTEEDTKSLEEEKKMDPSGDGSFSNTEENTVASEILKKDEEQPTSETQPANTLPQSTIVLPHPILDLSRDKLSDYDYLMNNFYIVDENTDASAAKINAAEFLAEDFSLSHGPLEPQILIYHSHSQETFSDSREGEEEDSIVGVGNYLTSLLTEKYGYQVIHIKEAFDMMSGELDRSKAYDYACDYVEKVLEENPSVEVVIDLHRDGIDENRRLVTEINGKETAQILFYNGLSYTNTQGQVSYLPNPYIQDNLAFSFQLEYQAALYYPTFYRGIYLAGLRYNLHLRKRSLLLEAGAQTNTVQEVKNAMEPFADILNRVLKGSDKQN
ncbi:stage II sporulation protein P [Blautia glucerasea]|uniref:stage II sporulation protein P n=1 Tax=Blautia glucerasea TaxID=536633 RepID=UPI001D00C0B7|nr:stage II sporulation protein P [Blautia glucerasea]MCB5386769.1 stage II sporulation protein P [Blautia glucerasea]MCB5421124.1 stage II sporulation protein P [Blautia luti]